MPSANALFWAHVLKITQISSFLCNNCPYEFFKDPPTDAFEVEARNERIPWTFCPGFSPYFLATYLRYGSWTQQISSTVLMYKSVTLGIFSSAFNRSDWFWYQFSLLFEHFAYVNIDTLQCTRGKQYIWEIQQSELLRARSHRLPTVSNAEKKSNLGNVSIKTQKIGRKVKSNLWALHFEVKLFCNSGIIARTTNWKLSVPPKLKAWCIIWWTLSLILRKI